MGKSPSTMDERGLWLQRAGLSAGDVCPEGARWRLEDEAFCFKVTSSLRIAGQKGTKVRFAYPAALPLPGSRPAGASGEKKKVLSISFPLCPEGAGWCLEDEAFCFNVTSDRRIAASAQMEREIVSEKVRQNIQTGRMLAQYQGLATLIGRPSVMTDEIIQEVVRLQEQGMSRREVERAPGQAI